MRRVELCGLLAAFIIASVALPASGATWHIYANGSGDAPTIKAAVGLAAAGDSIVVFAGTYNEHDIYVTKRLFIVSVWGETSTIIDAQSLGRCFLFSTFTPTITLKGFTLRHGTGQFDPVYSGFGGAVICRSRSNVEFTDCAFRNNSSNLGGAAVVRDSSVVTFKRCSFFDNSAYTDNYPGNGGALYLGGNIPITGMLTAVLDSCLFVHNTAHVDGGAIYATACWPSVSHSTFYQNYASPTGGAISYGNGAFSMTHSIVSHSDCLGLYTWYPNLGGAFSDNDFYANASGNYGGIIPDQTGYGCNISADPLYCSTPGDLSISTSSPCASANNPCGQLIGRYGPACEKRPNLVIASVEWSTTAPFVGTMITGTVKVKNIGDIDAGPFYIDYYKNSADAPPLDIHGDEYHYVAGLGVGDSVSWTTPAVTSPRFMKWKSWFQVDTYDNVLEGDEYDNIYGPQTIIWRVPLQSGWPVAISGSFHSSAVIAEIDGNPMTLEIAIGCDNGNLYAWKPDGSAVSGFPVTLPAGVQSSPAAGDVTGDSRNEIVVGCDDGAIYVYDCHGTLLWCYATGSPVRTTPSLADLNDDGKLEIICASWNTIHVLNGGGETYKGWPYQDDVRFVGAAVGDVDNDGGIEIAAMARIGDLVSKVYLFEANGKLAAGAWPVQLDGVAKAGPAIGEINQIKDGLEIVVGTTDGQVYVITAAGAIYSTSAAVSGSIESSPIIEDVDRDNDLDIVVTSRLYKWLGFPLYGWYWLDYVTAFTRSGAIIPGWPQLGGYDTDDYGPIPSAIALGDSADVMARGFGRAICSWYGSGAGTPVFPLMFNRSIFSSPAAGDVDGDGWIELFIAATDYVFGFELRADNYSEGNLWWPMYGHDRARTHCYGFDVPTAVEEDLAATPKVTALGSIYPNPFNPTTRITFDLSAKGHAELTICDVSGRKLAVLVDRELEAGRHEVLWNGRTAGGTTAASGIYFCTLRAAGVSETKKLVLLR